MAEKGDYKHKHSHFEARFPKQQSAHPTTPMTQATAESILPARKTRNHAPTPPHTHRAKRQIHHDISASRAEWNVEWESGRKDQKDGNNDPPPKDQ